MKIFTFIFGKNNRKIIFFIHFLIPFYGVLLLLSLFFYEMVVNNYQLYLVFYLLPFVLIYQIAYSLFTLSALTYDLEENIICIYLYDENLLLLDDNIYNGYKFSKENVQEIKCFIESNFDRKLFYKKYIKIYNKKPSYC